MVISPEVVHDELELCRGFHSGISLGRKGARACPCPGTCKSETFLGVHGPSALAHSSPAPVPSCPRRMQGSEAICGGCRGPRQAAPPLAYGPEAP